VPDIPDRRGVRIDQAVVAVLLAGAFVFSFWPIVPVVLLLPACGAVLGASMSPGQWIVAQASADRGPDHPPIAPQPVRDVVMLRAGLTVEAVGLLIASAGFLAGTGPLAWLVVLAIALVAVVGAAFGGWPICPSRD